MRKFINLSMLAVLAVATLPSGLNYADEVNNTPLDVTTTAELPTTIKDLGNGSFELAGYDGDINHIYDNYVVTPKEGSKLSVSDGKVVSDKGMEFKLYDTYAKDFTKLISMDKNYSIDSQGQISNGKDLVVYYKADGNRIAYYVKSPKSILTPQSSEYNVFDLDNDTYEGYGLRVGLISMSYLDLYEDGSVSSNRFCGSFNAKPKYFDGKSLFDVKGYVEMGGRKFAPTDPTNVEFTQDMKGALVQGARDYDNIGLENNPSLSVTPLDFNGAWAGTSPRYVKENIKNYDDLISYLQLKGYYNGKEVPVEVQIPNEEEFFSGNFGDKHDIQINVSFPTEGNEKFTGTYYLLVYNANAPQDTPTDENAQANPEVTPNNDANDQTANQNATVSNTDNKAVATGVASTVLFSVILIGASALIIRKINK